MLSSVPDKFKKSIPSFQKRQASVWNLHPFLDKIASISFSPGSFPSLSSNQMDFHDP